VEAVQVLWKRKHFEETSWKRKQKIFYCFPVKKFNFNQFIVNKLFITIRKVWKPLSNVIPPLSVATKRRKSLHALKAEARGSEAVESTPASIVLFTMSKSTVNRFCKENMSVLLTALHCKLKNHIKFKDLFRCAILCVFLKKLRC